MDDFLDFIIRNQQAIFGIAAVIAGIPVLIRGFSLVKPWLPRAGAGVVLAIPAGPTDMIDLFPFPADNGGEGPPPLSRWKRIALWVCGIIAGLFLLVAVLRLISPTVNLRWPGYFSESPDAKVLVVFVHGYTGDNIETWSNFPALLKADKRSAGMDIISVNYPTFIARRNLGIADLSKWLYDEHRARVPRKYEKVVVIAHSMGGLVAREWALVIDKYKVEKQFGLLIEIGTPHLGADLGALASALGLSEGFSDNLAPQSKYLADLADRWSKLPKTARPTTHFFTSPQDVVVSMDSAKFQCDDGTPYPQWGHVQLVKPEDADDSRYVLPTLILFEHLNR